MKSNENGLTLARWRAAAGYQGRATREVRAAWAAGEDPSDHRKANEEQRFSLNFTSRNPRLLPEPPEYARALLFSRAHALRCEACQHADAQLAPWLCCEEGLRLLQVARDARVSS